MRCCNILVFFISSGQIESFYKSYQTLNNKQENKNNSSVFVELQKELNFQQPWILLGLGSVMHWFGKPLCKTFTAGVHRIHRKWCQISATAHLTSGLQRSWWMATIKCHYLVSTLPSTMKQLLVWKPKLNNMHRHFYIALTHQHSWTAEINGQRMICLDFVWDSKIGQKSEF